MVTSSPASQRQFTQRASDASTSGRTPAGRRMETEPESVRALIGPAPVEDSVTLPLTVRTSTVPDTRPSRTLPDIVVISAALAEPTTTAPDLVDALAPAGAVVDLDLPRARPQIHLGRLIDADPPAGRDDAHRTERSLQLDCTRPRPHHDVGPRRTPHVDRLRGMDRLDVDDPVVVVNDLGTPGHDHIGGAVVSFYLHATGDVADAEPDPGIGRSEDHAAIVAPRSATSARRVMHRTLVATVSLPSIMSP